MTGSTDFAASSIWPATRPASVSACVRAASSARVPAVR
jgi:hypothetical protein